MPKKRLRINRATPRGKQQTGCSTRGAIVEVTQDHSEDLEAVSNSVDGNPGSSGLTPGTKRPKATSTPHRYEDTPNVETTPTAAFRHTHGPSFSSTTQSPDTSTCLEVTWDYRKTQSTPPESENRDLNDILYNFPAVDSPVSTHRHHVTLPKPLLPVKLAHRHHVRDKEGLEALRLLASRICDHAEQTTQQQQQQRQQKPVNVSSPGRNVNHIVGADECQSDKGDEDMSELDINMDSFFERESILEQLFADTADFEEEEEGKSSSHRLDTSHCTATTTCGHQSYSPSVHSHSSLPPKSIPHTAQPPISIPYTAQPPKSIPHTSLPLKSSPRTSYSPSLQPHASQPINTNLHASNSPSLYPHPHPSHPRTSHPSEMAPCAPNLSIPVISPNTAPHASSVGKSTSLKSTFYTPLSTGSHPHLPHHSKLSSPPLTSTPCCSKLLLSSATAANSVKQDTCTAKEDSTQRKHISPNMYDDDDDDQLFWTMVANTLDEAEKLGQPENGREELDKVINKLFFSAGDHVSPQCSSQSPSSPPHHWPPEAATTAADNIPTCTQSTRVCSQEDIERKRQLAKRKLQQRLRTI